MPERTAPHATERAADPLVYRPLSGLALCSLIVAGLYATVVAVFGGASMRFGNALILPLWTLMIPIVAAVLASVARRQILRSDGTRSGMGLANTAWWLSTLFGLGYAAFYLGTYFAVTWQAGEFTDQWLDKLRKGEVASAFLLTQDPDARKDDNPDDARSLMVRYGMGAGGRKGPLIQFQENEMVRIIQQAGTKAEIQKLGIRDWEHKGGYRVEQSYRVTTPEGVYDYLIVAFGRDSDQKRRWQILWDSTKLNDTPTRTPLGLAIEKWRKEAQYFAYEWLQNRSEGKYVEAYLATIDPDARKKYLDQYFARMLATAPMVIGLGANINGPIESLANLIVIQDQELASRYFLPGFAEFSKGDFVQAANLNAPGKWRETMIKDLKGMFGRGPFLQMRVSESIPRPEPLDDKSDRLRVYCDIDYSAFPKLGSPRNAALYRCEGRLLLESDAGSLTPDRQPRWRVVSLELLRGVDAAEAAPPRES